MNLILNMVNGVSVAGLAEGMAIADRVGIQHNDVLEILQLSQFSSPILVEKSNRKYNHSVLAEKVL